MQCSVTIQCFATHYKITMESSYVKSSQVKSTQPNQDGIEFICREEEEGEKGSDGLNEWMDEICK